MMYTMEYSYSPLAPTALTGDEPLIGLDGVTVRDFWSWGMSDLRTNTLRGVFAEFIVSRAVGAASACRVEWDPYDVMTPDGHKVEVKACAYLQGWPQTSLTRILFSGLSARVLDPSTNDYSGERKYNADVYVFAVQTATSHETLNVLDLSQWCFYVASGPDVAATGYRSLSLAAVQRIAVGPVLLPYLAPVVRRKATGRA